MLKLDELIIFDDNFLNKLNATVDKTIKEKEEFNIDYDLLEKCLDAIIRNKRNRRIGAVIKVVPIKKEELLSVALDFFKSIDDEFYEKARDIILGQLKRIRMNMYSVHSVKDFNEKDEFGKNKYARSGTVSTSRGNSAIHIPLQEMLKAEEAEVVLNADEGTLDDLYTIVHEIAHTLDLNQENSLPNQEEIKAGKAPAWRPMLSRELLGESTSIAFELLLTNYLLEKGLYPESAVRDRDNMRTNSSLRDARIVYTKLLLARKKATTGNITNEHIEQIMQKNNMSVRNVRDLARIIVNDDKGIMYRNRYAVGGLVAPTIIKAYEDDKTEGVKTIKVYLKAVYDGDFQGALRALGIELNPQGIDSLVRNMKAHDAKINESQTR